MIDFSKAHTWNRCPRCGNPVPPNEWASYMRCEDCWAANVYNPPHTSPGLQRATHKDARRGRRESQEHR